MNHCPRCDTEYEGDFCPRCGSPAEKEEEKPRDYPSVSERKLAAALKYVPSALFALYSVLLFLFYCTPVAKGISPSVYEACKLLGGASCLVAFGAVALVLAAVGLFLLPTRFFDAEKFAEKPAALLRKIWRFLPFALYFILYSVACSMAVYGGTGVILVIVFSVLFAFIHGSTLIAERVLSHD